MVRPMRLDFEMTRRYPTFFKVGTPNCATTDPEIFFPERGNAREAVISAKMVCSSCQYIGACREWAIENNETGVWGGTTDRERQRLRRIRKNKLAS